MSKSKDINVKDYHGLPCPYCKITMKIGPLSEKGQVTELSHPSRDHVFPRSIYVLKPWRRSYVEIVCHGCNWDKANRTLAQWYKYLSSQGDPRAIIIDEYLDSDRYHNGQLKMMRDVLHWLK